MRKRKAKDERTLAEKYPPSQACTCKICLSYCQRPGWWTVEEAASAIEAGYGNRMMLEVSPEFDFGVLSPAFKGCEGFFAIQEYSNNGCTFLRHDLCEIFGTSHQPLECRFCHHERQGLGSACHTALEKDWKTAAGQTLVETWIQRMGLSNINIT